MPFDLAQTSAITSPIAEIESVLRTIGALAVIAGTILVILQLQGEREECQIAERIRPDARVIDP